MARTSIPKYRAEYRDQDGWKEIIWDCRRYGRPTEENAEKMRKALNASFAPGGVNGHCTCSRGGVVHLSALRIVTNNATARVVAETRAPMFEVV